MKKLEQRLFHSLWKDNHYRTRYVVLNDMNYLTEIWADSEDEALQIFRSGEYEK